MSDPNTITPAPDAMTQAPVQPAPDAAAEPQQAAQAKSVRERLQAQKAAMEGTRSTMLPVSGISVTYPKFINHAAVLAATKQAGKNRERVGAVMVAQYCHFDGERLTINDVSDLLHNDDTVHLIGLIMGDAEAAKKDSEGN